MPEIYVMAQYASMLLVDLPRVYHGANVKDSILVGYCETEMKAIGEYFFLCSIIHVHEI